jgi:hypothetical protein
VLCRPKTQRRCPLTAMEQTQLLDAFFVPDAARQVDQRWAWRCSISSTARSDAGRRERKPRVRVPARAQENSGAMILDKLEGNLGSAGCE